MREDEKTLEQLESVRRHIFNIVVESLSPVVRQSLRELRLWHYRQLAKERNQAEITERQILNLTDEERRGVHRLANHHLKAVQTLNSFFPEVGDTAEKDNQNAS